MIISDGWGGAETVVYELAKNLLNKGVNVSIILNQEIKKYYDSLDGIDIFNIGHVYNLMLMTRSIFSSKIRIKKKDMSLTFLYYLMESLRPLYFKRISKAVMLFLTDRKIDLINTHLIKADMLVSNLNNLRIPWIGTIHGAYNPPWFHLYYKKLELERFNFMDKIIFMSKWTSRNFNDRISIKEKSIVIHCGIDISNFHKNSINKLELKGNFNILFPGGSKSMKGGGVVVQALKQVRQSVQDIHLYIALNVSKKSIIRKMVKDFHLEEHVSFLGFVQKKRYFEYLRAMDVLVLPSKDEAFGIVNIEAMALGKPIIASNQGGIPEAVINGRNGVLIEPNAEDVAEAILYLYRNEDVRRHMGENNLQDSKKFAWDRIIDKYVDLFKETINNAG